MGCLKNVRFFFVGRFAADSAGVDGELVMVFESACTNESLQLKSKTASINLHLAVESDNPKRARLRDE